MIRTIKRWSQLVRCGRRPATAPPLQRTPGFYHDFLGVRTRIGYTPLPAWGEGHAFGMPEPGKPFLYTREEWLGLLSAVEEASDTMVAVELGAGWGPWLVAAHVAARQRGIHDIHLIGVEACKEHADWMRQHFIDNDIEPDRHNLIYGAIGPQDGTAWFPMIDPLTNWGQSAHFYPGSDMLTLTCVSLPTLLQKQQRVDFVHCDIQGSESEVLPAAIDTLNAKVRRIVIATHAPGHDANMLALFHAHGWRLEVKEDWMVPERDGTQVWSNPRVPAAVRGGASAV